MIIGRRKTDVDGAYEPDSSGRILVASLGQELARDFHVGAVLVWMQGGGAPGQTQAFRPVVCDGDDPEGTAVVGEELLIPSGGSGSPPGWFWLPFDRPPVLRAGRPGYLGFYSGGGAGFTWLFEVGDYGDSLALDTASYVSVGDPVITGSVEQNWRGAMLAVGVETWRVPDVPDEDVAALPLDVASAFFGDGGTVGEPRAASAGWHYTHDAPPPPASCIVRTGGPLEDLVGERIRLTASTLYGPQSVTLYVIDEQPFEDELAAEDVSLSRTSFQHLAPLTTDLLDVTVEVMS